MHPKVPLDPAVTAAFTVDRLASLNDGVFAVAMTLLAYNVHVPHGRFTDPELLRHLGELTPDVKALCLSFAVAAMFWRGHINVLNLMRQTGRTWVTPSLVFLFFVVLLPISTELYGGFPTTKAVVSLYLGNLAMLALIQSALWVLGLSHAAVNRRTRLLFLLPSGFVSAVFLSAILTSFSNPATAMLICTVAFAAPLVVRFSHGRAHRQLPLETTEEAG